MKSALVSSVVGALIAMFATFLFMMLLVITPTWVVLIPAAVFIAGLLADRTLARRFEGAWTPARASVVAVVNVLVVLVILATFALIFR